LPVYLRPSRTEEALAALADGRLTVLAGGTDFYPARVGRPVDEDVLDISALSDLRGIRDEGGEWRIGATTTWSDVAAAPLPPAFDALKLAAREVGGAQIQNAGTVCGNLCNASPAADGVPPLLVLDARIELRSRGSARVLPLSDFLLGNRRTARRADELATAILIPKPCGSRTASHFAKLGARKYLLISIVMAAVVICADSDGRIVSAGIAVGACSPVARRLSTLEQALVGSSLDASPGDLVRPDHLSLLAPIDDVRADGEYRLDAALTLVRRALAEAAAKA
jgi:CO/xanthine dehydrogenase FAD-binding subunit